METQITHTHTPSDIGKTILSLGAILAVFVAFWGIQTSVKSDLKPELADLRRDVHNIEEKVNLMMGQQDMIVRRLNLMK
jgi:peroxiredoxin family protein